MKNTKHTEMNDSSIEQEKLSQSKRKILTSIGVTSTVVGASALVPSTWVKPAINSIIIPAHAQGTPAAGTTAAPATTTAAPATTTAAPATTTAAPKAAIVLSKTEIELIEGGAKPDLAAARGTYTVRLATMPAEGETVVVVITQFGHTPGQGIVSITDGDKGIDSLSFTMADWNKPQTVTVGVSEVGTTEGNAGGQEVRIAHSILPASDYGADRAWVTVTVVDKDVYKGTLVAGDITVLNGDSVLPGGQILAIKKEKLGPGELLVVWDHQIEAQTEHYLVEIKEASDARYTKVYTYEKDIRATEVLILEGKTEYKVRVTAIFEGDDKGISAEKTGMTT